MFLKKRRFTEISLKKNFLPLFTALVHYFGGVHFAILLIAAVLFFVIFGTFLESWSESHLFAAQFSYHHPFFRVLLWGFFINILFAALRRYPFKPKHIPFLITHAGLLMILAGVMIKKEWGFQGIIALTEGTATEWALLPNSFCLSVETRDHLYRIPLQEGSIGNVSSPLSSLKLTILEWCPHAEESLQGFIKQEQLDLWNYPPISLMNFTDTALPSILPLSLKKGPWHIYALKTQDAYPQFLGKVRLPALIFCKSGETEMFTAYNTEGESFTQDLNLKKNPFFWVFDQGFGGYATSIQLPETFPSIELYSPISQAIHPASIPKKREERTPCLSILFSEGEKCERVTLTFDPFKKNFKWPILDHKYLVRFQPLEKKIPFHIKIREGNVITYPNSSQPFSYECTLSFNDEERNLSMNRVYEPSGGYRFYLSHLLIPSFQAAKKVHIVVNRDPAKYFLTYPGGMLLGIGMLLLFFFKPGSSL